jgi:DNA-binding helix-hairpin-helix protein with protein kinase domain
MPQLWFFILGGAWLAWAVAGSSGSDARAAEKAKRQAAEKSAREALASLLLQMQREAGPEGFQLEKSALQRIREEFQALPALEARELGELHTTAQERQKRKFLERFFIDSADITGVGPARKAALRSFGIETAADVTRSRVMQVKGFGEGLTRAVTDWKASVERRFVFNPATAVSDTDKNAVRARIGARRATLAVSLTGAPATLERFKQTAAARARSLRPRLEQAAEQLAQAQSDLSLL